MQGNPHPNLGGFAVQSYLITISFETRVTVLRYVTLRFTLS